MENLYQKFTQLLKLNETEENSQPLRRQDSIRKVLPSVPGVDTQLNMSAKLINRRVSSPKGSRHYTPFIIEYSLLAEYNLLAKQKLHGIYVLPAAKTPLQWFGVVFVRQGFYQGGVFHFTLHIPNNFPDGDVPHVVFRPPLFHPLVKYDTGELDVSRGFPKWRRNVNHLWQVLLFARQVFYKIDTSNPINGDAARVFEKDLEMFKHKVSKCITHHAQHLYDVPDCDDPHALRFLELANHRYEEMKNSLISLKSNEATVLKASQSTSGATWVNPETLETFEQDKNIS